MNNLQTGIEFVGKAIQLDSEANLPEAVAMYQQALTYFEKAFMEESDYNRKNQILDKMKEYNDRMQLLNTTLQQSQPSSPQSSFSFPDTPQTASPAPTPTSQPTPQPTVQAPYSSFSPMTQNNQPQASPYENQHNSVVAPYSSSSSNIRAPYDSYSNTTSPPSYESAVTQPPPYSAPPPTEAWGDSFSNSPSSHGNFGSFSPPSEAPVYSQPPDMSRFGVSPNSSPSGSFTNPPQPQISPPSSFQGQMGSPQGSFNQNTSPYGSGGPSFNSPSAYGSGGSTFVPPQRPPPSPSGSFTNPPQPQTSPPSSFQGQMGSPQGSFNQNAPTYGSGPSFNSSAPQPSYGNTNLQVPKSSPAPQPSSGPKYHPFILHINKEHPRSVPNIQIALLIAEEAKKEDRSRQYQNALDLYTESLERFLVVYKRESNPRIKQTLESTIQSYMQRAEKIKAACNLIPNRMPDEQPNTPVPQSPSATMIPRSNSVNMTPPNNSSSNRLSTVPSPSPQQGNSGLLNEAPNQFRDEGGPQSYVGRPIQITNETKSLMRQKLRMAVSVDNNLVFPGDKLKISVKIENRSTLVVQLLKVTLRRIEKTQKYDAKGRQVMATDALKIHRQEFYQGSIFPLPAESNYTGDLVYNIPKGLKPTNLSQRGVYEREYDLSVQCDISMRKNLKVRFPLVIGPE